MNTSFDAITVALAAGVPRRHILRSLGLAVLGLSAGGSLTTARAQTRTPQARPAPSTRLIDLTLALPGHNPAQLTVMDGWMARITPARTGVSCGILPRFVKEAGSVELSIFRTRENEGDPQVKLLRRAYVMPGVASTFDISGLADVGITLAIRENAAHVDRIDPNSSDCCVNCSWGSACASEVCCDRDCPHCCGHCIDYGIER